MRAVQLNELLRRVGCGQLINMHGHLINMRGHLINMRGHLINMRRWKSN